jgi:flagellar biosynthesis/type III secretory pathway chaperone
MPSTSTQDHPPLEALKQWWPILLSVFMGLTGLGAMWANTNMRFDTLEQRVVGLELDRQHEREAMLKVLDAIQKTKEQLLHALSDGRFERTAALVQQHGDDLPTGLPEKWQQLKESTQASQTHLKRNELVIQRKLVVLREALQAMYQTNAPQSQQLYNRTGKLTGESRRS